MAHSCKEPATATANILRGGGRTAEKTRRKRKGTKNVRQGGVPLEGVVKEGFSEEVTSHPDLNSKKESIIGRCGGRTF